jgi:hypothetical protein
LGVEVETSAEVAAAEHRLQGKGLKTKTENQVACCYAVQDKVWVTRRTGTLLAAYLVAQGENPEKAIALVQEARPTAELRDAQKSFLSDLPSLLLA